MKLIQPKAELLPWTPGVEGVYKMIELAGRTCYKSTDKITEDSAKPFVDRMIASHHTAMLEHGTVYLYDKDWNGSPLEKYKRNKYSKYSDNYLEKEVCQGDTDYLYEYFVTTNLRVLVENNWLDDLKYLCDPAEFHEMRYSFKFTTSIGVTRELNRHRVNSIAEQSTRYCNYSKDKFGREIKFCIPDWIDLPEGDAYWHDGINYRAGATEENPMEFVSINPTALGDENKATLYDLWLNSLDKAEKNYMHLIKNGWSPQQAREVLPLSTATEIVHTAFASDWRHFFDLRLFGKTGAPHPNMKQLAELMKAEAEKQGIWDDIMNQPSKFN